MKKSEINLRYKILTEHLRLKNASFKKRSLPKRIKKIRKFTDNETVSIYYSPRLKNDERLYLYLGENSLKLKNKKQEVLYENHDLDYFDFQYSKDGETFNNKKIQNTIEDIVSIYHQYFYSKEEAIDLLYDYIDEDNKQFIEDNIESLYPYFPLRNVCWETNKKKKIFLFGSSYFGLTLFTYKDKHEPYKYKLVNPCQNDGIVRGSYNHTILQKFIIENFLNIRKTAKKSHYLIKDNYSIDYSELGYIHFSFLPDLKSFIKYINKIFKRNYINYYMFVKKK